MLMVPSTSKSMEDHKEELQSMWKIPAIASLVSLFHDKLNLPHLEIEFLEDGLLGKTGLGTFMLNDLIVAFLKGIFPRSCIKFPKRKKYA
ncbi:hypothetical protein TNCT_472921 [Trichonephila clavata]|uniref:Uncharacterized protein n=1 Tax=Trichonephila clavata TaxID=2740835 RepID=A0A8X6M178_TRICU|nr:hypothetical protein TNCT_472921 [Trichonephila clavata]